MIYWNGQPLSLPQRGVCWEELDEIFDGENRPLDEFEEAQEFGVRYEDIPTYDCCECGATNPAEEHYGK